MTKWDDEYRHERPAPKESEQRTQKADVSTQDAYSDRHSEAIELLREWYETYGGSTLQGGKPVDKSLDERTAAVLGIDRISKP